MTVPRGLFLLGFLGSLAVTVIGLRSEQARIAANIEQLQRQRVELRQTSWSLEMEISRLRTPDQVDGRVARWSLELLKPSPPQPLDDDWNAVAAR